VVDLMPAFDPINIAINSGLTLLELCDLTLARAEEEDACEIVLRIQDPDIHDWKQAQLSEDKNMRYAIEWLLGVPISILVIWFLTSHLL
jgi:hypothetical protein